MDDQLFRLGDGHRYLDNRSRELGSIDDQLLPSYYDGTQLVVRVRLPDRDLTISDVYDYVYGMHLDDGAKPWPYYRDGETGEWWSLSTKANSPIDALAWMIPLDQLRYKPRPDAKDFLDTVYSDLQTAAEQFGAEADPECSVDDALAKMDRVVELLAIRDIEMTIIVRAANGAAYSVAEWWQACERSGLVYGDGNLFWLLNDSASEDNHEPYEYFSVEPYSRPGYFHRGDLSSSVAFSDVALSFRVRQCKDPHRIFDKMVATANTLAGHLGAEVLTPSGSVFDVSKERQRLDHAIGKLRSLEYNR